MANFQPLRCGDCGRNVPFGYRECPFCYYDDGNHQFDTCHTCHQDIPTDWEEEHCPFCASPLEPTSGFQQNNLVQDGYSRQPSYLPPQRNPIARRGLQHTPPRRLPLRQAPWQPMNPQPFRRSQQQHMLRRDPQPSHPQSQQGRQARRGFQPVPVHQLPMRPAPWHDTIQSRYMQPQRRRSYERLRFPPFGPPQPSAEADDIDAGAGYYYGETARGPAGTHAEEHEENATQYLSAETEVQGDTQAQYWEHAEPAHYNGRTPLDVHSEVYDYHDRHDTSNQQFVILSPDQLSEMLSKAIEKYSSRQDATATTLRADQLQQESPFTTDPDPGTLDQTRLPVRHHEQHACSQEDGNEQATQTSTDDHSCHPEAEDVAPTGDQEEEKEEEEIRSEYSSIVSSPLEIGDDASCYDYSMHLPHDPEKINDPTPGDVPGSQLSSSESESELEDTQEQADRHYKIVAGIVKAMTAQLSIEELENDFVPARQKFLRYSWNQLYEHLTLATDDETDILIGMLLFRAGKKWLGHCMHYEQLFMQMYQRIQGLLQKTLEDYTVEDREPLSSDEKVLDWLANRLRPEVFDIFTAYYFGQHGLKAAFERWREQSEILRMQVGSDMPELTQILDYPRLMQPVWLPYLAGAPMPKLPQMPKRPDIPFNQRFDERSKAGEKLHFDYCTPGEIFDTS
ncbi:hypothetical protein H2200_001041 [Cladophialophora chaetospira]|uniref:Uncharacterized protein n=1 Tax=Cladophialophora chaetospira TaxID=386627 RepID=A0AA38XK42_9EURO|nr:hypothetical protein H2200_001041 [Cladophialophora chaetospira]